MSFALLLRVIRERETGYTPETATARLYAILNEMPPVYAGDIREPRGPVFRHNDEYAYGSSALDATDVAGLMQAHFNVGKQLTDIAHSLEKKTLPIREVRSALEKIHATEEGNLHHFSYLCTALACILLQHAKADFEYQGENLMVLAAQKNAFEVFTTLAADVQRQWLEPEGDLYSRLRSWEMHHREDIKPLDLDHKPNRAYLGLSESLLWAAAYENLAMAHSALSNGASPFRSFYAEGLTAAGALLYTSQYPAIDIITYHLPEYERYTDTREWAWPMLDYHTTTFSLLNRLASTVNPRVSQLVGEYIDGEKFTTAITEAMGEYAKNVTASGESIAQALQPLAQALTIDTPVEKLLRLTLEAVEQHYQYTPQWLNQMPRKQPHPAEEQLAKDGIMPPIAGSAMFRIRDALRAGALQKSYAEAMSPDNPMHFFGQFQSALTQANIYLWQHAGLNPSALAAVMYEVRPDGTVGVAVATAANVVVIAQTAQGKVEYAMQSASGEYQVHTLPHDRGETERLSKPPRWVDQHTTQLFYSMIENNLGRETGNGNTDRRTK